MNKIIRTFSSKIKTEEIFPYSTVKHFQKNGEEKALEKKIEEKKSNVLISDKKLSDCRVNEMNIQLLSKSLHQQIFGDTSHASIPDSNLVQNWKNDLLKHGINLNNQTEFDDVDIKLPKLKGANIEEHFYNIAKEQTEPYNNLIDSLLHEIPNIPNEWSMTPGWTCYRENNEVVQIDYPSEDALVFDVEVCMSNGMGPTLACAVSNKYWYSWTSPNLINLKYQNEDNLSINDLIPIESTVHDTGYNLENQFKKPKIIIGHNVSYDRARIKEQYWLENTGVKFLDTMSLHISINGITSFQRNLLKTKSSKKSKEEDEENDENEIDNVFNPDNSKNSSLNNLADLYKFYCNKTLAKDDRNLFVNGKLIDIKNNYQKLMLYCAKDVIATHNLLKVLYPLFVTRFPHPVTLGGMLELSKSYLPVNKNWKLFINNTNIIYNELNIESKYLLNKSADRACRLLSDNNYKNDLWMWDQDWSIQEFKLKKVKTVKKKLQAVKENADLEINNEFARLENKFKYLTETKELLPARRQFLPGYPNWYRKICLKPNTIDWRPGAQNLTTGMKIVPQLLALSWEGYPLHYVREHGWGFLMPHQSKRPDGSTDGKIPLERLVEKCPVLQIKELNEHRSDEDIYYNLRKDVELNLSKNNYYKNNKGKSKQNQEVLPENSYSGAGVWCNLNLENVCYFFKLPHKNGKHLRVGNPLSKDFLIKFSDNILSGNDKSAERIIAIAKMLSYWRNNQDRIMNQLLIWLPKFNIPNYLNSLNYEYGVIIPQVVVCGTLTRRAMEPTWMTASNAQVDRVGSELRSMIQAPPGYKIIGADVDSQELWIASVLGDASEAGIHGATPFGWMTLSGTKSNATDMHSVTAKAVGISRDHAKILNYARIYGAGQNFAERLLKQFNPTISDGEAKQKAIKMFTLTKGKKLFHLLPEYHGDLIDKGYSSYEALKISRIYGKTVNEMFTKGKWIGGTESAMFNRLEEIAGSDKPVTPFLESRLSLALEPHSENDDNYLPTRINWVVQSGAVDFLHLMLVCMRWLMGDHIRFCLSFHDEIRYLVSDNLAYKAALAMHLTNLLTRSFCAKRIGLNDLPQSIAFFTSVEIDTVLRKESHLDCKTPSNPHGLSLGYNIPKGESLNIYDLIKKTNDNDLTKWDWHQQ